MPGAVEVCADAVLGMASQATGPAIRVAVDGADCSPRASLVQAMAQELRLRGRPTAVIASSAFWRDASVRLEHGRTDPTAYLEDWLDVGALRREVLDPLGPGGSGRFLTGLRDPATNRSLRVDYEQAGEGAVVIVQGDVLLGRGLDFDLTIHLAQSEATRQRRTPVEQAWTLPALTRYDNENRPGDAADVVLSWNDPLRPAVRLPASR